MRDIPPKYCAVSELILNTGEPCEHQHVSTIEWGGRETALEVAPRHGLGSYCIMGGAKTAKPELKRLGDKNVLVPVCEYAEFGVYAAFALITAWFLLEQPRATVRAALACSPL